MEWYLIAGVLLVGIALAGSLLDELPLTLAVVYLGAGIALGPWGIGLFDFSAVADAELLEVLTEIAVIVSLFGAGLRLRIPIRDRAWWVPIRLAFLSMAMTVGLIALLGWWVLDLPIGFAILVGAVLAPTDPVLAGEVQVRDPWDRDRLRTGLTAEAGLNDGTAFPFVLLGLGLMGLNELGPGASQWIAVDLIGATIGGLAIGGLLATAIGRVVLHLRRRYEHAVGLDGLLLLGVLAIAYGGALLTHTYGFLAAFAAGLALRRIEHREQGGQPDREERAPTDDAAAIHPDQAPAYLAHTLMTQNEQLERIGELGLVVLTGVMLARTGLVWQAAVLVPAVLLVIRPLAVMLGLIGAGVSTSQRRLTGWFGLRGIGSLYYLAFAIQHGMTDTDAELLASITLSTIVISILVHGVSVTPVLNRYRRTAGSPSSVEAEVPL